MKSKVSVHTRLNHALNELQEILTTYFVAKHPYNEKGKKANQLLEKLYFSYSIEMMYLHLVKKKKNSYYSEKMHAGNKTEKGNYRNCQRHCLGPVFGQNDRKISVHTRLIRALNELPEILTTYFVAKHPYNEKGKKANQLLEKLYFSNSIEMMYLHLVKKKPVTTRK